MKSFLKLFLIPILFTIFSLTITIIYIIQNKSAEHIFSIFGLALASWVIIILRLFKLRIPFIISILYYIFIFFAIGLGAGFRVFDKFYLFDSILHFSAGLLIPILALYIISLRDNKLNKFYTILFIFSISMMTASIWEVIEFSLDQILGMNTQHNLDLIGDGRSGVYDTMKDIICHLGGTIITSTILTIFYKKLMEFFKKQFNN